jgi:hypothetical protein
MFVGGQEHRYEAPPDPVPPASEFTVLIEQNLIVGNASDSGASGALRVTMDACVRLTQNVLAENRGDVAFDRAEVHAERNIVWQDWRFSGGTERAARSRFAENLLPGRATILNAPPSFTAQLQGNGNVLQAASAGQRLEADTVRGVVRALEFAPATLTTRVTATRRLPEDIRPGRVVRMISRLAPPSWHVIREVSGNSMIVWGRVRPTSRETTRFEVLPSFRLRRDAPGDAGAIQANLQNPLLQP